MRTIVVADTRKNDTLRPEKRCIVVAVEAHDRAAQRRGDARRA